MSDELLPHVAAEMREIEAQARLYEVSADQAMRDLRAICSRGRDLAKHLRNMRRTLRRNTKRLCDALDAISH